jgi:hypothetical protein
VGEEAETAWIKRSRPRGMGCVALSVQAERCRRALNASRLRRRRNTAGRPSGGRPDGALRTVLTAATLVIAAVRRVGVLRPTIGMLAGVLGFVAVTSGCSGALAPGNAETDRIAKVVSDAISYPYQKSAAGYARVALATRAGQDDRLRVVAIEELKADELGDPLGRLVFLVHLEGSEAGWTTGCCARRQRARL